MTGLTPQRSKTGWRASGMTLVEMMVAVGLSSILLAAIMMISMFGSRSFAALGNYTDLNNKNRNAMDLLSRDIREAAMIVDFKNSGATRWLLLTNNSAGTIRYVWDSSSEALICKRTGQPDAIYLAGCQRWDFEVFQRTPQTNVGYVFFPATNISGFYDPTLGKVVNMSWKCSRTLLNRFNTESVQTAQVVLRNKQ